MPLYDACIDANVRIIHTRHEGAAVYMAEAYAQITGKMGVALVTAGPGLLNAISALYSVRNPSIADQWRFSKPSRWPRRISGT